MSPLGRSGPGPLRSISGPDTPALGRLASNSGPEKSPFGPLIVTSLSGTSALGPLRSISGPEIPALIFPEGTSADLT